MIRISKLTDYGIVLLTHIAQNAERPVWTARDLAQESSIPLPTVGKLLKALTRGELLESLRGMRGGYRLARPAEQISIAAIIRVLEGPVGLTECSSEEVASTCGLQRVCPVQDNWQKINRAVLKALDGLTLSDMRQPLPRQFGAASVGMPVRSAGLLQGAEGAAL